jgi:hypothetical protein
MEPSDSELIDPTSLRELDLAIEHAFATGAHDHLRVLGYGEISSVIAWPGHGAEVACKRLPVFSDKQRFLAYQSCLTVYLERLRERGVQVVETRLYSLDSPDGRVAGYCVQPVLAADNLGPNVLARSGGQDALAFFDAVLTHVLACVSPTCGLDGQLSNWALAPTPDDGEHRDSDARAPRLLYLDVSTPLMRDPNGRDALDKDLFLSSLPWALRGLVKRLMLRGILATYFDARRVMVDFLANLHKERLAHLLPAFIDHTNQRGAEVFGEKGPIGEREVARYYRDDARTWALLQRLRRMDRTWQHSVRRRSYPFLLPGPIQR